MPEAPTTALSVSAAGALLASKWELRTWGAVCFTASAPRLFQAHGLPGSGVHQGMATKHFSRCHSFSKGHWPYFHQRAGGRVDEVHTCGCTLLEAHRLQPALPGTWLQRMQIHPTAHLPQTEKVSRSFQQGERKAGPCWEGFGGTTMSLTEEEEREAVLAEWKSDSRGILSVDCKEGTERGGSSARQGGRGGKGRQSLMRLRAVFQFMDLILRARS